VILEPPKTGTYSGILLFQARSNTTLSEITAGASIKLNGLVYMPTAELDIRAGSGTVGAGIAQIITNYLQIFAGAKITGAFGGYQPPSINQPPHLVE
jgi:hypothetical protein